jgi:NAD(P)-dependent dehydrogenase (short-subunit alcohol dehydrogenase family)
LVTGGATGIGRMIAEGLVVNGARVFIASRKRDVCEQTAEELGRLGSCIPLQVDVADVDSIRQLIAALSATSDRLDILVNNSGTGWVQPLESYSIDGWDKTLDVNLRAALYMITAALPLLRASATPDDPARVINIGSVAGISQPSTSDNVAYGVSKAGLHHLSTYLAAKLGPDHITVNAIAPGPFESKMMAETLRNFGDSIAASSPLNRIGRPDDMAGAAIFLASRAGAYVTGAVIPIDGGISTTK